MSATWLGLAVILFGVVRIGADTPYPGTAALIPVVGTALMISGMSHTPGLPARLLSTRFPRWVGRISYSLYLWHWPILVLVPIALGVESVAFNLAPGGGGSAHRLGLDRALRRTHPPRHVVADAAESERHRGHRRLGPRGSGRALAWGNAVQGDRWTPGDVDEAVVRSVELPEPVRNGPVPADLVPPLAGAYWDLPDGYDDGCHLEFPDVEAPECVYGDPEGETTVMLLGDSHAQQWLPALQALADERSWRLRAITKSACPMVDGTVWNSVLKRGYRECDEWRETALELIEAEAPALVLVAADGRYELMDANGDDRLEEDHDEAWQAALTTTLERMGRLAPMIVIADTPRVGYDPAECLATSTGVEACATVRC